jgi:NitT/TauT family transport system permease protein
MRRIASAWQAYAALLLVAAAGFFLPLVQTAMTPVHTVTAMLLLVAGAGAAIWLRSLPAVVIVVLAMASLGTAWALIAAVEGAEGQAGRAFYLLLVAAWLLAWQLVSMLSVLKPKDRLANVALRLLIPALFGVWILILWEAIVRGAGIPFILLPPPSLIGARMAASVPVLAADVVQTIGRAALSGYVIGCVAGLAVAILADRFIFLRRGLLPLGNLVSALPLIGIAPIMVMWFGFDWQSKAAVVVIMTFFPMLVNTVTGLAAAGHMERDLMRTYASDYWQTLLKLRLPAAMPFIFNALKINSTLALIGAIVAEFFGTPVVGMGFRISTEVGRMNVDMVWAEIAVAAVIGSVFYGLIALAERAVTFWHPSVRGG